MDLISNKGAVIGENLYASADGATAVNGGIYWVLSDGKYRLYSIKNPNIPVNGDIFTMVTTFGNGVAAAGNGYEPIQLIRSDGKAVATLPDTIVEIKHFQCGLAPFKGQSGKWGYIDTEGKEIIKPEYDIAYDFDPMTGLALVQNGDGCDADRFHVSFDNVKTDCVRAGDWFFRYNDDDDLIISNERINLPKIYDNAYLIRTNDQLVVTSGEETGLTDLNNNIIIPLTKYTSIQPLSNGNYMVVAPDWKSEPSEIRAGKGGEPEFIGQFKSNIYDKHGKLIAGPFGKPQHVINNDMSVTYTNLNYKVGAVLEQLTPTKVFGFGEGTTATDVAEKYGWAVTNSNATNFLYPPKEKTYYVELGNGEYANINLCFNDNILRELTHTETRGSGWTAYEATVKDGYQFNTDAKLESVQASITVEEGMSKKSVLNYVNNKMTSLGFDKYGNGNDFTISSGNGFSYIVTIVELPDGFLLSAGIPSPDAE